jgi:hypothetical protein
MLDEYIIDWFAILEVKLNSVFVNNEIEMDACLENRSNTKGGTEFANSNLNNHVTDEICDRLFVIYIWMLKLSHELFVGSSFQQNFPERSFKKRLSFTYIA